MKVHIIAFVLAVGVSASALMMDSTVSYTRTVEARGTTSSETSEYAEEIPTIVPEVFISESIDDVSAASVVVMEVSTGEVVYEHNPDQVRPIASISKLFTAYAVDALSVFEDPVRITQADIATTGAAGNLGVGEEYTFRELLFPLLLTSSNDAGAAIMRTIGTDTFLNTLDTLYEEAGLVDTDLVEPTGLSPKNQSTAQEIASTVRYLHEHVPFILSITQLPSYQGNYRGWNSNLPGRELSSWRGGKHGYIPEADRTFAGMFEHNGAEFVLVLLGSSNLSNDLALVSDMLE